MTSRSRLCTRLGYGGMLVLDVERDEVWPLSPSDAEVVVTQSLARYSRRRSLATAAAPETPRS
jgi:hypothetical protein